MDTRPKGEVTIQTIAMPKDTNANGDIFGGWLLSQMDLAAGILAKKISNGRVATVAVADMTFLEPVQVGDIVTCYANLEKTGKSSMSINIDVWSNTHLSNQAKHVTTGTFICVAIDMKGKPRKVHETS
jgi:acyl-CoA thioesterase YciA